MSRLVDPATLARELGVSRGYIYEHAAELGQVKLSGGPKARKRFDLETARAALACYTSNQSQPPTPSVGAESDRPRRAPRGSLATRQPQPGLILRSRPKQPAHT